MYSASRAYHSALAQVVLPAYFIAPVKIHTELEKVLLIHVTVANVAFIVLFSTLLLKAAKKGEERSKLRGGGDMPKITMSLCTFL